jgi:hypothetical protein
MFENIIKFYRCIKKTIIRLLDNPLLFLVVIILIIVIIIVAGYHNYISINDANKRITVYEEISKIASIVTAIVLTSTFILTSTKYWLDSYQNRRRFAHEFLMNIFLGRVADIRQKLNEKIDPYSRKNQSYYDCVREGILIPYNSDDLDIKNFLNHLEYMCIAVNEGLIDEAIARDSEENLLYIHWKWFYPYMLEQREKYYPEAWIFIDKIVQKWKGKEAKLFIIEAKKEYEQRKVRSKLNEVGTNITNSLIQLSQTRDINILTEKLEVIKIAIEQIERDLPLKLSLIDVLRLEGEEALKKKINHPLGNMLVATIEHWHN